MSMWDQANKDAYRINPSQGTQGKTLGFFDSFAASWDEQTRSNAAFGIQEAMRNADDAQMQLLRKAGVESVPSLSRKSDDPLRMVTDIGQDYLDTAKFYQDGGDPAMGDYLSKYDKQIEAYKKQFPALDLQTSQEMWDGVRQKAQNAEQLDNRPKDLGGQVGGFVGGMLGGVNPNTNPIGFGTLPIGGLGKNVLIRVGEQAGVQAGAQTINEMMPFSNVGEQRRLLGIEDQPGDAFGRIFQAGLGGAAGQGVGEALGLGLKGLRRVFRDTTAVKVPDVAPEPKEPLPLADVPQVPPGVVPADEKLQAAVLQAKGSPALDAYFHEQSPWSTNRAGRARTALDLDYTATRLNDWSGDNAPWQIEPKTDTAPVRPISAQDFEIPQNVKDLSKQGDINALMRKVDPETMVKWDNATSEKQTASVQLKMATEDAQANLSAQHSADVQALTDQIASLDAKIANVGAMKAKKLRGQRVELEKQRVAKLNETMQTETPTQSVIRARVMAADEKLRDLAPLVTRAKVRAQGRWEANGSDYDQVIAAMRDGNSRFQDVQGADTTPAVVVGRSLEDILPQLQRVETLDKPLKAEATAADAVQAVTAQDDKVFTEAADAARSRLKGILDKADKLDEDPQAPAKMRADAEAAAKAGDVEKADKLRKQADDLEGAHDISVAGYNQKLNMDEKLTIEQKDGSLKEATLREHLRDMLNDEEDLQAVTSCSVA